MMNLETMLEKMLEAKLEQMMMNMLGTALNTSAEVAPAPTEQKPEKKHLSREEFLAISEEKPVKAYSLADLDFEVVSNRTCKYNGYVPSDVWTVNHLAISKTYGAKWSKKSGGYVFESSTAMRNFLQSYQIKTVLDDTDRHNIKVYKQEKAKARAEYYAKKAAEV